MVTSHHLKILLLFIVGCHLACGKSRYGRYQNYDKKCQLRLYAVPEFRKSNDIIDSDVRVRRQRRNDKSLSTIGKVDFISLSEKKNHKYICVWSINFLEHQSSTIFLDSTSMCALFFHR